MPYSESFQGVARLGDIWRLGDHRLVCGDSTTPAVIKAAFHRDAPNLMVTDPPYGVGYAPDWRCDPRLHPLVGQSRAKLALGRVLNDDRADWSEVWRRFPGAVAYVWHSALHASEVETSLRDAGFVPRAQIVWDKGRLIISRGHYHWRHETCWYAVRKGATANWTGDRKQTTVWLAPHRRSETGHAAQKPILCMERPVLNHTRPGDAVFDPFVGSGTTIMACDAIGRRAIGIELNPSYCDMAIARWMKATGGQPERVGRVEGNLAPESDPVGP